MKSWEVRLAAVMMVGFAIVFIVLGSTSHDWSIVATGLGYEILAVAMYKPIRSLIGCAHGKKDFHFEENASLLVLMAWPLVLAYGLVMLGLKAPLDSN